MTRKVWIWLGLTFVSSWLYFLTYNMFGEVWKELSLSIAMFMPALMVLVVKVLFFNEPLKGAYLMKLKFNRFIFIGILLPVVLALYIVVLNIAITPATLGVSEVIYQPLLDLGLPEEQMILGVLLFTLVNGIAGGMTINTLIAFGGEYGWRGFLEEELSYLGSWKPSLLIGAIWGLWSTPLVIQGVYFEGNPVVGIFLMIVASTFLGSIISYFTKKSGTILTAAFFVGVFSAVSYLPLYLTEGYNEVWHGPFGVIATAVYMFLAATLYWYDKRRQRIALQRQEGEYGNNQCTVEPSES